MAATLTGVGVGPGDPELVTRQAERVLREADRVVAPSLAADAVGRAESIVRQVVPNRRVDRVVVAMGEGLEPAAAALLPWLDAGEHVAFVTLGDPSVYSTFPAVAEIVRRNRLDVAVGVVPGIMAFQDLAARAGTVLVDDREALSLVTALDGTAALDEVVDDGDRAVVVYKGGRHLPAIAERLAEAGRLDGAVAGELLGLPGERVGPVKELADGPAAYLSTVIVPPRRRTVT